MPKERVLEKHLQTRGTLQVQKTLWEQRFKDGGCPIDCAAAMAGLGGSVQRDPWTMPSPEDNWNKRPSTRQVGTCHPRTWWRGLFENILRVSKCYFVNVLSTGATRKVHTSPASLSAVLQTTPTHYHQHPVQKYIFFLAALRNHFIMPEPTV